MIKMLIDGPSASVKASGDMQTIIAEVGYGIKILYDEFKEHGRGELFEEAMTHAVEFVFRDDDDLEDEFNESIEELASKAVDNEAVFDIVFNRLHSEEAKADFAKAVLKKMREKK